MRKILVLLLMFFLIGCGSEMDCGDNGMEETPSPSASPMASPEASPEASPDVSPEPVPSPIVTCLNEDCTMLSQGPLSASVAVNDASTGSTDWFAYPSGNLNTNIANLGDSLVDSVSSGGPGFTSHYLKVTGFGFNIPLNAIIRGILVESAIACSQSGDTTTDHAVRIVKGGTIQSTDRSGAAWNDPPFAYRSYGSSSDLWGTTWTPADINAATFGYAHSISTLAHLAAPGGAIDHTRITVFYEISGDLGAIF